MKKENNNPVVDFAHLANKDAWLSHPVFGDPSFDSCERYKNNPICRGTDGLEWPVNGFVLDDPISRNWFAYVGHYPRNYSFGDGHKHSICTVFRSKDHGLSWESLGPVFPHAPFFFTGDKEAVTGAPDVSVVFYEGKYHMTYDWLLEGTTWGTTRSYRTGVGYAWSDKPEGPFIQSTTPIVRGDVPASNPVLGKYDRFYATTLIRRKNDWLILILTDSGKQYAWGLLAMTAKNPEGPYGEVKALLHVEGYNYQPPLMEYFPAFVYEGWVYSPSTSVALNRDFQMIQRAKIEEAMNPEAWEMFQHGSVWHGENFEHEAEGMWGQTFSAFIDSQKQMQILFPSKDNQDLGTINMAKRPWDKPYRKKGFYLSGHQGASLGLLKKNYVEFYLECQLDISGVVYIFWDNKAPLGPDVPKSNAAIHSLSWPHGYALRLEGGNWQFLKMEGEKNVKILAFGAFQGASKQKIIVEKNSLGIVKMIIDQQKLWEGEMAVNSSGAIGLLVGKNSYVKVESFLINGVSKQATLTYMHTEGLLGAGQGFVGWNEIESSQFRYHVGAVCDNANGRIKWNFTGSGFTLWQPKGSDYGKIEVFLDGKSLAIVDLYHTELINSEPVLTMNGFDYGFHALVLKPISGSLVVDCIDVNV